MLHIHITNPATAMGIGMVEVQMVSVTTPVVMASMLKMLVIAMAITKTTKMVLVSKNTLL